MRWYNNYKDLSKISTEPIGEDIFKRAKTV